MAGSIAAAIALIALAIAAAPAHAASTRAEYVAQVDPICKAGQDQVAIAAQPLLRAVKRARKHHALDSRKTQRRLSRLSRALLAQDAAIEHSVIDQIAAVPPVQEDVSLIQVWLRARTELADLESRLFVTRPGRGIKGFTRLINGFFTLAARQLEVEDLVRDFGFQYCNTSTIETQFMGTADFIP